MSRNIVFEGWLTKSPPSKRIWRTKWRRRWFALRQSGELPGQYFLDYYADRNCRRLKGTINLDLCEQVDAGLHMERAGNGTLDPKLRGSVFTIQTQSRTYHLEADCETEMEKWVDAICRVCGLIPTEDENTNDTETYQNNNLNGVTATNGHYSHQTNNGPYIPISECITGVRAQGQQRAFTFDTGNIVVSTQKSMCDKSTETSGRQVYASNPTIKVTCVEFSENESSDDDIKSLNASQANLPDRSVTKTFTKLQISSNRNHPSEEGPPLPPRPPVTFSRPFPKEIKYKETFQGPKIQEPIHDPVQESIANYAGPGTPWLRVPRRMSTCATPHHTRNLTVPSTHFFSNGDEEDEYNPGVQQMQYYNLTSLPPAVDRALKPRHSSHNIGHIHSVSNQPEPYALKPEGLQYLDLDLPTIAPRSARDELRLPRTAFKQRKFVSGVDGESAYKTVDFLKTEAFNITRQDAEASRSHQN